MRWHPTNPCSLAPGAGRLAQDSFNSQSSVCAARLAFPIARRHMPCAIPSRRIFWGQAATCARSRNFWGTPLCPRRKSIPPSIACDCLKPIARRIRAGGETLAAWRGEDYPSGAIGHIGHYQRDLLVVADCFCAIICSAISSAEKRLIVSGSVMIDCVLFCALKPGPPILPEWTASPSPDADQFVEPSPATLPSATKPLVWLI